MCSENDIKNEILRRLKQAQIRILEADQVVQEQVIQSGVGTKQMHDMVNGDSKELKRRVIKQLRDSNTYTKEELEQLIKQSV